MIVRAVKCAAVLLTGVLAALPGRPSAEPLGAPLTNDLCPTSSFGSWRSGHLHAGLDFSTGGVTGVPVLAVDSCRVWRVRLWNGGYGRALYAELKDGKTAIYGHLSGFIAEIERLVEEEQDRRRAYEVELLFESEALIFAPGDTLAFSGETGSGPPHLHFELRSGRGEHDKINPVPDYMDLPEAGRPVIKALRLMPLGPESCVSGSYDPVTVSPGPGTDTLVIAGPFGMSVRAADPVQCGRVLKPVHYMALIDRVPVFLMSFDRFPFSKGHYVGGLYESVEGSRFVRLYDAYGLDLRGFSYRVPEGPEEDGLLAPGGHELAVSVADAWGNTQEVAVPFRYGTMPHFGRFSIRRDSARVVVEIEAHHAGGKVELFYRTDGPWHPLGGGPHQGHSIELPVDPEPRVEVLCRVTGGSGVVREGVLGSAGRGEEAEAAIALRTRVHSGFVEIYASLSSLPSSLPVAVVGSEGIGDTLVLQPVGENLFRGVFVPGTVTGTLRIEATAEFDGEVVKGSDGIQLARIRPGRSVWLSTENYRVSLAAPGDCSIETLVTVSEEPGSVYAGFQSSAGRLRFEPLDVFFSERLEVLVCHKDRGLGTGYGVFADAGKWASFRGRFNEKGQCEFRTRQPENLVVLADREGPEIAPVSEFRTRPADGKATFASRITDGGSGVSAASLKAYVDGEPAIVSRDPDTGRITGRTIKPLPYGEHRIRLEAEDRLGNTSGREFTLDLSR